MSHGVVREHVTTITDPAHRPTRLEYNGPDPNDLTAIVDPDLARVQYSYDNEGRKTLTINALGGHEIDVYDRNGSGRAVEADRTTTDSTGQSIVSRSYYQAWQDQGLPNVDDPAPRQNPASALSVGFDQLVGTYTAANGNVEKQKFNPQGLVLETDDSLGTVAKYTRDGAGDVLSYTDATGHLTVNTYDDRGNRLSIRDEVSAGSTDVKPYVEADPTTHPATVMTYDGKFNVLTSVTDELGHVTTYVVNYQGNVLEKDDADGDKWFYTYTPQGLLSTTRDLKGNMTNYSYDPYGRLWKVTNADNTYRTYTYNDNTGNPYQTTDENGNTTTYYYDAMNRALLIIQPAVEVDTPLGQPVFTQPVFKYKYDAAGNKIRSEDGNHNAESWTYDEQSRMLTHTAGDGGITTYHYDATDELVWSEDPLHHRTIFTYDKRGRLVYKTDPLGGVTEYRYNDGTLPTGYAGSTTPVVVIDPRGAETDYRYDARGRLVETLEPYADRSQAQACLTSVSASCAYMIINKYDGANNLSSTTDADGHTTTYSYSKANRLLSVAQPDPTGGPGPGPMTQYTYDLAGNRRTMQDPDQNVTTYGYDQRNRLTGTTDPYGFTETTVYDGVGNKIRTITPNRTAATTFDTFDRTAIYTYDALNRLVAITLPAVTAPDGTPEPTTTKRGYDGVGNLVKVTDARGNQTRYGYDAANRRNLVIDAMGESTYTYYDLAGRVTATKDALGRVTKYVYDALSRLVETDAPDPVLPNTWDVATKRGYDADGNVTSVTDPLDRVTTYSYDKLGRVVMVTDVLSGLAATAWTGGTPLQFTDSLGAAGGGEPGGQRPGDR